MSPAERPRDLTSEEIVAAVRRLPIENRVEVVRDVCDTIDDPMMRSLATAPMGEPLSEEEQAMLAEAEADVAAGRVFSTEGMLRGLLDRIVSETDE